MDINQLSAKDVTKHNCMLMILAVIVGILGAVAAYIFEAVIAFIHNLSFAGKISFIYHDTIHTPASIWGIGVIIPLIIGALIVTWILTHYAAAEKGLSVSEIMYAIHFKDSVINPKVALAKIVASSITIGTGGSVGREGPFIQIGAALSALLSNIATLPYRHRGVLIAAGSAAIISSTFNAPLAGIAFAIEFLLLSVDLTCLIPVSIASFTAIIVRFHLSGVSPILFLSRYTFLHEDIPLSTDLLAFIPLGIVFGLVSWAFILAVYKTQDIFGGLIKNPYLRHTFGMTLVGIIIYLMMFYTGRYYVEGIGFAIIQDTLRFLLLNPWLLLLIVLAKFLTTCLTLGSGASGGIFAPALVIGATLGALASAILQTCCPSLAIDPTMLILAGMVATLSATSGALLTAILLVLEMTWYYHSTLPIIIAAISAFLLRKAVCTDSIYTLKFQRKGITLPQWP